MNYLHHLHLFGFRIFFSLTSAFGFSLSMGKKHKPDGANVCEGVGGAPKASVRGQVLPVERGRISYMGVFASARTWEGRRRWPEHTDVVREAPSNGMLS